MYFDTGSVMRSRPSSIIIMIATPVMGLVIDAMRKTASLVIGFFESMSVTPVASKCAILPCRATSVQVSYELHSSGLFPDAKCQQHTPWRSAEAGITRIHEQHAAYKDRTGAIE